MNQNTTETFKRHCWKQNEEENERDREFGDKINNLRDMLKNIASNPQVFPNY